MKDNRLMQISPVFILLAFVGFQAQKMFEKEPTLDDFIVETIEAPARAENAEDAGPMSQAISEKVNVIGNWREKTKDGSWFEFVFNVDNSFSYRIVLNRRGKEYYLKGDWEIRDGMIYCSNLSGDTSMLTTNKRISVLQSDEDSLSLYAPPIGYFTLKK